MCTYYMDINIQEHVQEERLKRPYEVFSEDMMMCLQLAGAQQ